MAGEHRAEAHGQVQYLAVVTVGDVGAAADLTPIGYGSQCWKLLVTPAAASCWTGRRDRPNRGGLGVPFPLLAMSAATGRGPTGCRTWAAVASRQGREQEPCQSRLSLRSSRSPSTNRSAPGSLTRPPPPLPETGSKGQGRSRRRSGGQRICSGFALAGVGCAVKGPNSR